MGIWIDLVRALAARLREDRGAVSTEYVIVVATLAAAALAAAAIIAAKIIDKANGIGL